MKFMQHSIFSFYCFVLFWVVVVFYKMKYHINKRKNTYLWSMV